MADDTESATVMSTQERAEVSRLADPVNQFSVSLFHSLSTSELNAGQNVFLSPFSVSTALSMLLLGARNESAKQMMKVLCLDSLEDQDNESVHKLFHELIESRIKDNESLMLSNCVLVQKSEEEENKHMSLFKEAVMSNYSAQVDDVDFESEGNQILFHANKWVREKTKGLIEYIMDEAPQPATRLILLNAIYFKGKWDTPFDKENTQKQTFYNNGDEETEAEFMFKYEKSFPYTELVVGDQKCQVVELPYQDEGMSMTIVLPEEKDGLKHMISSHYFAADVTSLMKSGITQNETIDIYVPKFQLENEYDLNQTLEGMGMTDIFGPEADLSGITGHKNLSVSLVKHKAVVKVDEEGTVAAAVTAVHVRMYCAMYIPDKKTFRADHPFLFFIKDKTSGLVLFVGKVESL